jgi:hypothetical protein
VSGHGDHADLWDYIQGHSAEIAELLDKFVKLEERVTALEGQTPAALQAERELAETLADNAGWDYHGRDCNCPYCATDEDEESPLARRDAYIGTWSNQDVTRRADR